MGKLTSEFHTVLVLAWCECLDNIHVNVDLFVILVELKWMLAQCCLVTPYGNMHLGQYWLGTKPLPEPLLASQRKCSPGIISQGVIMKFVRDMCSDIKLLILLPNLPVHYGDVVMGTIATQITSLTVVYSTVYSDADQGKHQSSASLAFVWGIHRGPVNSPHKWPVTRKMFPFDDVIMG